MLYLEFDLIDMLCCRKILEYMKCQNLMLNETIFNALVKGHVRKGFVSAFCIQVLLIWDFILFHCLQSYVPQCLMLVLKLLTDLLCVVQWCCWSSGSHGRHEVSTIICPSKLNNLCSYNIIMQFLRRALLCANAVNWKNLQGNLQLVRVIKSSKLRLGVVICYFYI